MNVGDIVRVEEIGHVGQYRIIHSYNDEPAMFLVVKEDDFQAVPKCYHVLKASCTLVEERNPPAQPIRSTRPKAEPIIKRAWAVPKDEKEG